MAWTDEARAASAAARKAKAKSPAARARAIKTFNAKQLARLPARSIQSAVIQAQMSAYSKMRASGFWGKK